ncbi:hypothetical protein CWI36_0024p0050 [Hamiltosporidium magnivora]|uniref:Uncharacterized protein n=1 Tax=Hamiltosporidium magnivora TaxID=148818 RepID=A0A4Q9LMC2_9MICR|nr:hypothetical protein CWI36_0024p0050 [Hamiltosporidium magnivora]
MQNLYLEFTLIFMSDNYILCSSSSEENEENNLTKIEIPKKENLRYYSKKTFSLNFSYENFLFYKNRYIGKNSIPSIYDISFPDGSSWNNQNYIRKQIKKNTAFFHVNKWFSENLNSKFKDILSKKYKKIEEITKKEIKCEIINVIDNTVPITLPISHNFIPKKRNKYDELCSFILDYSKTNDLDSLQGKETSISSSCLYLIKESVLSRLLEKDTQIYFEVVFANGIKKYLFYDWMKEAFSYEESILKYMEERIEKNNSNEISIYKKDNKMFFIYFDTCFIANGKKVYCGSLKNNSLIYLEKEGINLITETEVINEKSIDLYISVLNGLELEIGEYILFNKNVYKHDNNGKRFKYTGLESICLKQT